MNIAEKITVLRKEKGMTQEDLAEQLNVTRQAVSRWESEASYPESDKLMKLATIFDVNVEYLMNDSMMTKTQRKALVRNQNFDLSTFIINVIFTMGYIMAIALTYIKDNHYVGLLIMGIFFPLTMIAFAIFKTFFIKVSDYDSKDRVLLVKNTKKYYMISSILISAFIPVMFLNKVENPFDPILGYTYTLLLIPFGTYIVIAIYVSLLVLGQLILLVNPLYLKKTLKQKLGQHFYLTIIELALIIVITVSLIDGVTFFYICFFVALLLGGIIPIILAILKKIKVSFMIIMLINGLLIFLTGVYSYGDEDISMIIAIVLFISNILLAYYYFKKRNENLAVYLWFIKNIVIVAICWFCFIVFFNDLSIYFIAISITAFAILITVYLNFLIAYLVKKRMKKEIETS